MSRLVSKMKKSVIDEGYQIQLATKMIKLGSRLVTLEAHVNLSRERLIKLYKELNAGKSPSKGMLPFSTEWFLTWTPNIHSSIFFNIYQFFIEHTDVTKTEALVKAYDLYLHQSGQNDREEEPVLSITRAWTLIRFVDSKMLRLKPCTCCAGKFIVNTYDLNLNYSCGLCNVPSRAGKTKKAMAMASEYKLVAMSA